MEGYAVIQELLNGDELRGTTGLMSDTRLPDCKSVKQEAATERSCPTVRSVSSRTCVLDALVR